MGGRPLACWVPHYSCGRQTARLPLDTGPLYLVTPGAPSIMLGLRIGTEPTTMSNTAVRDIDTNILCGRDIKGGGIHLDSLRR